MTAKKGLSPFRHKVKGMGWAPELPSIKDWDLKDHPKYAEMKAKMDAMDESEDRRSINPPVRDQHSAGACVGFSSTYGVGYLRRTDRDKISTSYSPLQLYFDARVADGAEWQKVDSGAYIRDAMNCLRDTGVAPESKWPYKVDKELDLPKRLFDKPTASVYKAAGAWKLGAHWRCNSLEEKLVALANKMALVGGITCYGSMFTPEVDSSGRIPMPSKSDSEEGGHALYYDRFQKSDKLLRFENSWTETWGDRGYGYLPFEYAQNPALADDFWAMEAESPATTPWKD